MNEHGRVGILFVCTGNICRSPLAEGVFMHRVNEMGVADRFDVESAGTMAWNQGQLADPRAREIAATHDVVLPGLARQVRADDFERFEHLICMDEGNREALLQMGAPESALSLLLEHDENATLVEVPDPYHGGDDGFALVYRLIDSACAALAEQMVTRVS